jgi:pimeloyl-ACP methyl ester carboxylesterase
MPRQICFIGVVVVTLLCACSTYSKGPFWKPPESVQVKDQYTLGVVEFDDQGWYHNPEQASEVLNGVYREASQQNAVIVVFVHGWHHNSEKCDQNLACFRKTLERLKAEIDLPYFVEARRAFGTPDLRVIGIYVGWRGRSLPMPLDYATFWDRKPAGHRSGGSDLRDFLTRLDAMYQHLNPKGHLTGLVAVGHSFGGAVLENSLSQEFTRSLALNLAVSGTTDLNRPEGSVGKGVYPVLEQGRPGILEGFGDLVVLVNPAFEASLYHTVDTLARRAEYSPCQAPILMTLSAENDGPRKRVFPLGRFFSTTQQAVRNTEQRKQIRRAFGVYEPQHTHTLAPVPGLVGPAPAAKKVKAAGKSGETCVCEEDFDLTTEEITRLLVHPSLRRPDPREIHLAEPSLPIAGLELKPKQPIPHDLPFLVVDTSKSVIDGHNGFFNNNLIGFLVHYIGITEAKKFLLKKDWYAGSERGRWRPEFPCTQTEEALPNRQAQVP